MKRILLSLVLLLNFLVASYAQEKQLLYFDQNDNQVASVEEAFIIREIDRSVRDQIFSFKDFIKSTGDLKLTGSGYFDNSRIVFHGDFVVYGKNGAKLQEFSFVYGQSKGIVSEYFANGQLKRKLEKLKFDHYDFDRAGAYENDLPNLGHYLFKLNYLADSSGKVLVADGNGYLTERVSYLGENYVEEGSYVDGLREGIWHGIDSIGSKSYQELYRKGVLKRGEVTAEAKKVSYSKIFTAPNYKYSNNHIVHLYLMDIGFYKKYVPAIQKSSNGDYWILVTLSVNENGNVDQVVFDRALNNYEVQDNLTMTLLTMPFWKPATLRGQKVRAKYKCAIPFFKIME